MAYPAYLREKARKLRVDKGLTIDELSECLALSRSTIYYWVRDLPIRRKTKAEWPESARLAGGRAISEKYERIRKLATNKLTYGLQYHQDQDPEYLKRFWAFGLPGVESDDISLQRKSNSNRLSGRRWRSRWGVLTVTANDTQLRMRLEGWIVELESAWLDSLHPGA